ncbi:MAG: tetratricopeptide repeat protein, partial [Thermodesulfobacteriota bacterium]
MNKIILLIILIFLPLIAVAQTSKEYTEKGFEQYMQGNIEKAVENYNKAIQADKNNIEAYYLMAAANLTMGQPEQAIQNYSKAIDIDSKYSQAYAER